MDSLREKEFEKWPIGQFASFLKISRNTAQRLFDRDVFPEDWVKKTKGGKRFVLINQERISTALENYQRWKIISRKPHASKSLPDPNAIGEVVTTLMELRMLGERLDESNWRQFSDMLLSREGEKAFGELKTYLTELAKSPEGNAIILVAMKILEFKQRYDVDVEPTSKDLSKHLCCSVASLYRSPFGKGTIKAARYLISRSLHYGNPEQIEHLANTLKRKPSVGEIRQYLIIPERRAEDLLEEWKEQYEELSSDFSTEKQPLLGGGPPTPDPFKNDSPDEGSKHRKIFRDRKRRRKERELTLDWYLLGKENQSLHLYAEPVLEREVVREYSKKKKKREISNKQYDRALAQIESQRRQLGCIIQEGSVLISRLFHPYTRMDISYSEATDAISCLVERSLGLKDRMRRPLVVDSKKLCEKGIALWETQRAENI